MKRITYYVLLLSTVLSCADSAEVDEQKSVFIPTTRIGETGESYVPSLTFLWETESLLTTVESVLYDPLSGFIYAANIEGNFMEKDGEGSISKINLEGEIVALDWITGLDAPTGLSIANGIMYTTDIDRIIEIDVASGKIRTVVPVAGAKALNDITTTPEGVLYASDTGGNTIYKLEDGLATPFLNNIETPNGLVYHNKSLLISQWTPGILQSLDLSLKEPAILATGLPEADGIEILGDQGYLVSSWGGRVFFIDHEGNTAKVLDTSSEGKNAADVSLIAEKKMLLIATFSKNTIAAYRVD